MTNYERLATVFEDHGYDVIIGDNILEILNVQDHDGTILEVRDDLRDILESKGLQVSEGTQFDETDTAHLNAYVYLDRDEIKFQVVIIDEDFDFPMSLE